MSKAEKTKQYIIERAAPVFNAKGYAGTSLQDLIEVTGLTKGSIYGNFENKDEVAIAVFEYNFSLVVNHIRSKMAMRKGAVEKLLIYPEVYRNFLKLEFLKAGCPLLNTATEADDAHPALKEKARQAHKFWKQSLEKMLLEGVKAKELNRHLNIPQVAAVIMSLIEGAVMQAKLSGKAHELEHSMDYLENMIQEMRT